MRFKKFWHFALLVLPAIYTAAMEMIGGSKEVSAQCRKVDIMADAAYAMLTKDTSFTGNFCIDDEVLRDAGITDMDQYACVPGEMDLANTITFKRIITCQLHQLHAGCLDRFKCCHYFCNPKQESHVKLF